MSIRWIGTRLYRHGRAYVRDLCRRREYYTGNIADALKGGASGCSGHQNVAHSSATHSAFAFRNVGAQFGLHARRVLIDNVLSRVTNTLAADLRKKAARRLLYGDSGTFLAFVGVSLASGTGILTKEDELEGVCFEIREAISKIKWSYHDVDSNVSRLENEPISLDDLTLGAPIAKGANAVVYTAKINDEKVAFTNSDHRAVVNQFALQIIENENAAVEKETIFNNDVMELPLAVKMMFNYDIQSSALSILKAMYRETIPARIYYSAIGTNDWEFDLSKRQRHLPAHPNIIAMYSVFTGYVPDLVGAATMYPAALPRRINPNGFGRNMSLFLLMKRYSCTLHDYLNETAVVNYRHNILLFAQLLEGIVHLVSHGISHRDLKADNLLLDVQDAESPPQLVISDFGCCLADKSGNLTVSYNTDEVIKGGNSALMAPEIICAQPGTFSTLNYARSDLWAAGTIAYQLFGRHNPFYATSGCTSLRNVDYKMTDLPELPNHVPMVVRLLVKSCLERNPNKRLDPEIAANVIQLYLWAPSYWLKPGLTKLPSNAEILQWLLTLTTKVLCESRQSLYQIASVINVTGDIYDRSMKQSTSNVVYKNGRRTYPEYMLISTFLCRARLYKIKSALKYIQNGLDDI